MYSAMQNLVKIFLFAAFMLVVLAGLTACAASGNPASPASAADTDGPHIEAVPVEQMAAPVRDIKYMCTGQRIVNIRLQGPERIDLNVDGAGTTLLAVRSASGARFESRDGSISFWSKGNEARLETSDGVEWQCVVTE